MHQHFQFLRKHNLFSSLNDEQIKQLLVLGKIQIYKAEEVIIEEGETSAPELYLILEGDVEVLKREEESQNFYRIATLPQGAVLGEMSLLENIPRAATICAVTEATILSLSIEGLRAFKNSPSSETQLIYYMLVEKIAYELCIRLRDTNQRIAKSLYSDQLDAESGGAQANLFGGLWQF